MSYLAVPRPALSLTGVAVQVSDSLIHQDRRSNTEPANSQIESKYLNIESRTESATSELVQIQSSSAEEIAKNEQLMREVLDLEMANLDTRREVGDMESELQKSSVLLTNTLKRCDVLNGQVIELEAARVVLLGEMETLNLRSREEFRGDLRLSAHTLSAHTLSALPAQSHSQLCLSHTPSSASVTLPALSV